MKKLGLIKKQALLAILSLVLCLITILGLTFSAPSKPARAAENGNGDLPVVEEIPAEESGNEGGDDSSGDDTNDSSDTDNENGDNSEDESGETTDGDETPTPTPTPSGDNGDDEEGDEGEATPSPTPTDGPSDSDDPPVCDCTSHCTKNDIDDTCPVCKDNFKRCEWIDPKVAIAIDNPTDWRTKATKIGITVVDENNSGHFYIDKVEARIGSTGSYTDITDDMYVEISENCTLYIQVTEENGNVTTKSRKFSCFDTDRPTINAGIEGELLYVEADDATSGVYAIYVNGTKFTDLNEGKLSINIKDYDSVYEYVTIQAYDHAGNRSNTYKIKNPYYVNPESRENKEDQSTKNPQSTQPTGKTSATATVTSHTDTEGKTTSGFGTGNSTTQSSKPKSDVKDESEDDDEIEETKYSANSNEGGKEFYTITTDSEKVFYLIIDKDQSQQNVYLLTEVNENDLLNFVNYNGETVVQGDIPLYTVDPEVTDAEKPDAEADDEINVPEEPEEEEPEKPKKNNNSMIIIIILAAIGGVGLYFFKKKGRKPDYDYEADAEDIDTFEPVTDTDDDDEELFFNDEEEDGIPADIDESVMEDEDE